MKNKAQIISLLILSIVAIGFSNNLAIILCTLALIYVYINMNNYELSVSLIIFFSQLVGYLGRSLNVTSIGAILIIIFFFLHILFNKTKSNLIINKSYFIYLIMFIWVSFSYLIGPNTVYSLNKFLQFNFIFILYYFIYRIFYTEVNINMTLIGISAITISLMYYLLARHFNPVLLEYSIFNIGHMKLLTQFTFRGEVDLPVFSVGNIAIIGSAFLLSDQRNLNNKNDIIFILLALLVGFVLVNASGQRQYYIILFLIITSLLFTKSKNNTLIIFLFLLIIVVLFSVVMIGLSIDLPFITSMFYNSYSLEEMVNRKTNWDAAIYLIKENIFTGIGFGGYYIPGYSFSGSGTYAHNLVLEVFSEMGLIGLAIFIIFPVFIILSNLDSFLNHKFLNGANYLPIFVVYLSQSMISFDLSKNAPLFSIFLLYYSYSKK